MKTDRKDDSNGMSGAHPDLGGWDEKDANGGEHCRNSAGIAAGCLQPVALQKVGYLAGLLHDMGKYTAEYRTYLNRAVAGEPVRVGSVIHTHAAVRFLIEQFHEPSAFTSFEDMSDEILVYAAGAHHGLYDCVDEQHRSGFSHRLAWDERLYSEAKDGFFSHCADEKEIQQLFAQAHEQLLPDIRHRSAHK